MRISDRDHKELAKLASANFRLAAIGQIAGELVHELSNSISVLSSNISILQTRIDKGSADINFIKEKVSKINNITGRMTSIFHSTKLMLYNPESNTKENKRVSELLIPIHELCSPILEKLGISLEIDFDEDFVLNCNSVAIQQVLFNLVMNSKDAIKALNTKWIRLYAIHDQEKAQLIVEDSGCGIPTQIAQQMFEPLFSTKSVKEGTGLGLVFCKKIIEERHGGKLFYREAAHHTRIVAEIPLLK